VPYLAVVGDKEVENGHIAVRTRRGEDLGSMTMEHFLQLLDSECKHKSRVETET